MDIGKKYGSWPVKAATAGFGMYDDVFNEGKTPGEAATHTASSIGFSGLTGTGGGAAIAGTAAILGASSPVGWGVVSGLAISAVASWGFDKAYDSNFMGLKTGTDWAGEKIDKAGEAISDKVKSLNPFS